MKMPHNRPSMLFLDPQPVFHMRPGQLVHLTNAAVNNHNLKVRMGGDPFATRFLKYGHLYRINQVMSSAELVETATGEVAGWFNAKEMIFIRSYKGYTLKLKTMRQSYSVKALESMTETLPWVCEYYDAFGMFIGWFYSPFGYAASFRGAALKVNDLIEAEAAQADYDLEALRVNELDAMYQESEHELSQDCDRDGYTDDNFEIEGDTATYTYPDDSPSWGSTAGAPYSEDFQDWY